jgi:hypothetical protein
VKARYNPPKCSHKNNFFAFGLFGTFEHQILDYFVHFKYIAFASNRLKLIYLKRNSNKNLQIWTYEIYLCQNKHVTEYEKLQIYFKTKGGVL